MVEILAAGLAGSTLRSDVKPLKTPEGAPHNLGQTFLLIDPGMRPDFHDMVTGLARAVRADSSARIPGTGKNLLTETEVPDALWDKIQLLASR